ncbi:hypothetical protein RO706_17145 [Bacteroides koreensis]|uniref:Uncharacterized protein n=1 Tax=Bacteroides koreensis TaxID=1912896 RepID=A0ABU3IUK0_9BACE|nr:MULTISPECIES: hypothetical protein [Bacteroides]MDC2424283.1 hypothetical protein [Bacteroides ovatus]MDC2428662.1 hypothetical protein [Bacteroides ovatus]MDC2444452.1 hypothetical protein [Bacteroides ovatus]MDC2473891.1 hypothetical protein [Bacteroides ovatus]MDC2538466.1 hypothetical protein [Bacteroides ovatus]
MSVIVIGTALLSVLSRTVWLPILPTGEERTKQQPAEQDKERLYNPNHQQEYLCDNPDHQPCQPI